MEKSDKALSAAFETLPSEDLKSLYDELTSISRTEILSAQVAVDWASKLFQKLFTSDVESLLKEHPLDEVDDEGNSFWGGARRRPVPLHLNIDDIHHKDFIVAASKLWLQVYKSSEKSFEIVEYTSANFSSAESKDDFDFKRNLFSKVKDLKQNRKVMAQSIKPMVKVFYSHRLSSWF